MKSSKARRRQLNPTSLLDATRSCRWIIFVAWIASCQWLLLKDHAGSSSNRNYDFLGWNMFACAQSEKEQAADRQGDALITRQRIRGGAQSTLSPLKRKPKVTLPSGRQDTKSINQLLLAAGKRGLGGGVSGALAGVVQVFTLMWLRTIMTYQNRYGTSFHQALQTLLRDGGIPRLYRGLSFALVQAPLCRFVSTAANDGVNLLLSRLEATKNWGPGRKVAIASLVVGFWRIVLMPIDTMKTVLQVDSTEGFRNLLRRVKTGRLGLLYQGTLATYVSSVMGHYPWYWTYNMLDSSPWLVQMIHWSLLRSAGIGFVASVVSDTVINSVRVVKTTKQSLASKHAVTYAEAIRMVLAADGWRGLFGRGLQTRIMGNAIQSIVFTVIWRSLADASTHRSSLSDEEAAVA